MITQPQRWLLMFIFVLIAGLFAFGLLPALESMRDSQAAHGSNLIYDTKVHKLIDSKNLEEYCEKTLT